MGDHVKGDPRRSVVTRLRGFVTWHSRGSRGWLKHRVLRAVFGGSRGTGPVRLHVGSGCRRLEGWVNVDLLPALEVDLAVDVRDGLPFDEVEAVYAEHFLEHLTGLEGLAFLREAWRVLGPGAWLRLSTPNLDWVLAAHRGDGRSAAEKELLDLGLNRSFYGWGHRFPWSGALLVRALDAAGFVGVRWCRYGESDLEVFRGLERHDRCPDTPDLPHVLIVEARKGEPQAERLNELEALFRQELERYL